MEYIAQEKDYWIHADALSITLNALGNANRIQASVSSGAVVMCYIANANEEDTLGYNAAHSYKSWPLAVSPTYFNSNTAKYVYVAIPRNETIGTQAIIVFPSEQLDIYGKNAANEQIGSTDYLYIWLQGIISNTNGTTNREWRESIKTGKLDTDEGREDAAHDGEWYSYSAVSSLVTLLKELVMSGTSWFRNLRLGSADNNLTGVAKANTTDEYIDADFLVVTPNYLHSNYLSKKHDDVAEGNMTFNKNVSVNGDLNIKGWLNALKAIINELKSNNYSGSSMTDTGFQLTSDDGNGNSQLVVDNIIARMKFVANILEVRKLTAMGGNYVFSPAASEIEEVDYFDDGGDLIGYEYVKQPWLLRGMPVFLRRTAQSLGIFSTKRLVRVNTSDEDWDWDDVKFFRCWLKADDGSTKTINTWRTGMLARCQTFDASQIEGGTQAGTYEEAGQTWTGKNVKNKMYWRAVIGTGDSQNYTKYSEVLKDGKLHNYIDLANTVGYSTDDYEFNLFLAGSDYPAAGDDIVCFGDYLNRETSNVITIDTVSNEAPCIKELVDVGYRSNHFIDWAHILDSATKTRISPIVGNKFVAPEFVIEITDGGTTRYVNIRVALDGLTSTVSRMTGSNRLLNVDTGTDWKDDVNDTPILVDSVNFGYGTGDGYGLSPVSQLSAGNYVVSYYCAESKKLDVCYKIDDDSETCPSSVTKITDDYITVNGVTYNRYYYVLTLSECKFQLILENGIIYKPQLEPGTKPTPFNVGRTGSESYVKQTADAITARVANNERNITQLQITATGIQSDVSAIKAGKNLLSGVLTGEGWKSCTTIGSALHGVTVNANDYIIAASGDSYLVSPQANVQEGKKYTLSFYLNSGGSLEITVKGTNTNIYGVITGGGNISYTFTATNTEPVNVYLKLTSIRYPQLELGDAATEFDTGTAEVSSRIKQTADEIELKAGEAGLNISGNTREINLIAGKVNFKTSGGQTNPKISIDTNTGTLHAVDGDFEGVLKASSYLVNVADLEVYCYHEDGLTGAYVPGVDTVMYDSDPTQNANANAIDMTNKWFIKIDDNEVHLPNYLPELIGQRITIYNPYNGRQYSRMTNVFVMSQSNVVQVIRGVGKPIGSSMYEPVPLHSYDPVVQIRFCDGLIELQCVPGASANTCDWCVVNVGTNVCEVYDTVQT